MNAVTFPLALLATGQHTPTLCVRHGQPAAARWSFGQGVVRNWPYCRTCVTARWVLLPVAVLALATPLVVGIGGAIRLGDTASGETFTRYASYGLMLGVLLFWVIVLRTTPSGLARAKVTPSRMFVVIQGAHLAFAAEAQRILQQAYPVQPQPGQAWPVPGQPHPPG